MGLWQTVKELFSDPFENCYLNDSADISEHTLNGGLELHEYAWIATGIAACLAAALSFYLIYHHCRNYTCKYQQRFIIRILLMVPIYALDSFLSFRLYSIGIYFDLLRDTYEAFVINTFFCLLIEYTGGYDKTKEEFAKHDTVKLIFPLNCISVKPKRGLLRTLKKLTLQYVIIRPLTALIAVILQSLNLYCPGNWNFTRGYIYITAILFISVTLAMYALIMFYSMTSEAMAEYRPIGKFLAVKFIIFMSFWQSIIVAGLVYVHLLKATAGWSTNNIAAGVQNVLICGEMLIAAIVHIWVFSYKPFVKEGVKTPLFNTLKHVFSPKDMARDVKNSFFPKQRKDNKQIELQTVSASTTPPSSNSADGEDGFEPTAKGYKPQVDDVL